MSPNCGRAQHSPEPQRFIFVMLLAPGVVCVVAVIISITEDLYVIQIYGLAPTSC